jgi:ATP-binding cassette subfamily A (ABC1) protein 3
MKISAYWLGNYIYDYLLYAIIAIIAVILIIILQVSSFNSGDALAATWILFMLYGLAYIPFTYICSYLFKDYGSAQAGFYFFSFITGGMLPIITLTLRFIGTDTNKAGRGMAWALRVFPCFSFGEGLINIASSNLFKSI